MNAPIQELSVAITRFVAFGQPSVVECEFVDADGRTHRVVDKVPMFVVEDLDEASRYPRPGLIRCEVRARWRDAAGRELVRITTARPDSMESVEALTEFVVLATQVSESPV